MNISLNISKRNKELEKEVAELRKILSSAPKGDLMCHMDKGHLRFYHLIDNKKIYLNKTASTLTQNLVLKDYCLLRLSECEAQLAAGNAYRSTPGKMNKKLHERLKHTEYLKNLKSSDLLTYLPVTPELQIAWIKEPYETNPLNPNERIHRAPDGTMVRSKSEIFIATLLSSHHIAYRYECRLDLGDKTYYPDFTIMHPVTGKIFYWEHNGMIDVPEYRSSMFRKQDTYIKNNIIPGINLILTYETKDHPLDLSFLENLIDYYFS